MKLPRMPTSEAYQDAGSNKTAIVKSHEDYSVRETTGGLSVLFTILCIVDLFGVFPVITLPRTVLACGLYGIPLVLVVFSLQLYTAVLLGRCWLIAQEISPQIGPINRSPYAAVAELAFGPRARNLVTFLIDATVFGAGIPNLIVASESLQMFGWKISGGSVGISYCVWMLVIGLFLCPVMWLGSPKDMKPLAVTSVIIVSTVTISIWSCILQDNVSPPNQNEIWQYEPSTQDFLMAYGIIAFQFDIHPMLLTIQVDMKDSRKINTAVIGGFSVTAFMFAVTTAVAAARYGQQVDSNIMQGIPASIPLYLVALLVTLQLCLSSAVGNSALFQHIEHLLHVPRNFCIQRCIIRSSIVAIAVFLGESVPRFDLVMGFVGSTLTGPLMFIFPPLFFLKLCYMKKYLEENDPDFPMKTNLRLSLNDQQNGVVVNEKQNGFRYNVITNGDKGYLYDELPKQYNTFTSYYSKFSPVEDEYKIKWYEMFLASTVMVLGIAATIVATYSSWSNVITAVAFSPPCLLNSTAAARTFILEGFI